MSSIESIILSFLVGFAVGAAFDNWFDGTGRAGMEYYERAIQLRKWRDQKPDSIKKKEVN